MNNTVCIPTFNGERYIKAQIESILPQLAEDDEIVISDDSSFDRTVEVIRSIADKRIRIYEKNTFRNPIFNLENSIIRARGDIIYLADQDDVWLPRKVSSIAALFSSKPDITLVATNAKLIDYKGTVFSDSFYCDKRPFKSRTLHNLVKNRFLGCTLAFRRTMLDYILPFPQSIPMHDIWIGIMNEIYGRVHFIDQPLILYRRHENNFSPSVRTGFKQIAKWRWNLIKQLIKRMVRIRFVDQQR